MKLGKILMILLIVGLILVVGCSNKDYNRPPTGPTGGYVGGGCGVAGVPEDVESVSKHSNALATAF
ncbi:MAG: hypothetical protein ISS25_00980 [Nanoarchaeota archaeon]|nr:hypothetical protein [DPANN group archaeon]MBL7116387.1 hypothetical protein [Nanoarchaeota archaeon]